MIDPNAYANVETFIGSMFHEFYVEWVYGNEQYAVRFHEEVVSQAGIELLQRRYQFLVDLKSKFPIYNNFFWIDICDTAEHFLNEHRLSAFIEPTIINQETFIHSALAVISD